MATNTHGRGEGSKNVAAHGVPEPLSATKKTCGRVIITARPGNGGVVAVGFSNAVRAVAAGEIGVTLSKGQSITIEVPDLSQVWLDSTADGEGVSFLYYTPLEVYGG